MINIIFLIMIAILQAIIIVQYFYQGAKNDLMEILILENTRLYTEYLKKRESEL